MNEFEVHTDKGVGQGETNEEKLTGICFWSSECGEATYRGTMLDDLPSGFGKRNLHTDDEIYLESRIYNYIHST